MTVKWSEAFTRSRTMPAVFRVRPDYESRIHKWLGHQNVPSVRSSGMYESTITAWAILNGGITATHAYGMTGLPSGLRVVGWQPLRLLAADLDLTVPSRPMPGEGDVVDGTELRRRHLATATDDSAAASRAEALAACSDYKSLRWAVRRLLGDTVLIANRPPDAPAHGVWGDAHFSQAAADRLTGRIDPSAAFALAQTLRVRRYSDTAMGARLDDLLESASFDEADAADILELMRLGVSVAAEWHQAGMTGHATVEALKHHITLETAKAWLELGAHPDSIVYAVNTGASPQRVAEYCALGYSLWPGVERAGKDLPDQQA
jgi:hypothetical protein